MRMSTLGWLILSLILISGCSAYVQHERHIKACHSSCKTKMVKCEQMCHNNCPECTMLADTEAAVHFNQYQHQQCVQGSIAALELQSFRDPLQCRKPTCDCKADYQVCYQGCLGKIHKRLKVVPPC